jgi:hypothetical protein
MYNISALGSIFGGSSGQATDVAAGISSPFVHQTFSILVNFSGFLFSPNRGLFIFCPILILSIWGYYSLYRNPSPDTFQKILLLFLPFMAGTVLVYSAFSVWYGGWGYGPRYLIGLLPVLSFYTGYGIVSLLGWGKTIPGKRIVTGIILLLVVISVVIEAIGAWAYPYSSWDKDLGNEKAWNWSDSQIVDSYYAGANGLDNVWVMIWPSLPPPYGYVVLYRNTTNSMKK